MIHNALCRSLVILMLLALTGCTVIRYGEARYFSVLQKKSLILEVGPDGKVTALRYSTDSDVVLELARELSAQSRAARMAVAP